MARREERCPEGPDRKKFGLVRECIFQNFRAFILLRFGFFALFIKYFQALGLSFAPVLLENGGMDRNLTALKIFSFALFFLSSGNAFAFPEMVRHGYLNCTSCHVSPTGGGVLTAYGRELSKDVLASASKEGEEDFAYGLIKPPEWLSMGGDFRELGLYQENATSRQGQTIIMQNELEGAGTIDKKIIFDGTFGYFDAPNNQPLLQHLISRRHFVVIKPTETSSFRVGKFMPAYGINTADHQTMIRHGIGFQDEGTESYNLEAAWIGETLNAYATVIFGRPDSKTLDRETGAALSSAMGIGDTHKGPLEFLDSHPSFFYSAKLIFRAPPLFLWQTVVRAGPGD